MSIPTYGCVCRKEKEGGAVAVVTVRTLSQQLRKTVFTKIKLPLSGLDFFMDGWLQFTGRLRGKKGLWLLIGLYFNPFSHKAVQQATLSWQHYTVSVLDLHSTSHTMIILGSPIALVRINPAKLGSCQWDWEKVGCCKVPNLPHQSPPVWMKKAESGADPPLALLPTPQEPEEGRGERTLNTPQNTRTHLLFLLDGLTGIRHQPGNVRSLPWRRFTAQPLTPWEQWKSWHKPGNTCILSTHISCMKTLN